jgi:centractin
MAGAVEGETFIGQKAQDLRGILSIHYPMEHGVITNWESMEKIWQYVYSEELKTLSEEHPVLFTEAPLNPLQNRSKAAEIFFETFNVPALVFSVQAVLALYASGRTTGIVLDVGDGVSHTVPVFEGFAVRHAIKRMDVAGRYLFGNMRDVTENLQLLLRKEGNTFTSSAEFEVVRLLKEKTCFVSLNPAKEEKENSNREMYTLPDGRTLKVVLS